jgi:hypothetical protein
VVSQRQSQDFQLDLQDQSVALRLPHLVHHQLTDHHLLLAMDLQDRHKATRHRVLMMDIHRMENVS